MASSYSSVSTRGCRYEVFLSFRGEDTRYNFVDHLYAALVRSGITVFKDDEMLQRGKEISPELVEAIRRSTCAVVVLSKTYANSSWCLGELTKIMECHNQMGQLVIPVFYHVDPSDIRRQKRAFEAAFLQHQKKKSREEIDEVKEWKEALTAVSNLSGHHISEMVKEGESDFISKIVQDILDNIQPRFMEKKLIGIEPRINELNLLLAAEETQEVRMVGIWGMGGIGKTTIARALFRRISCKFEGSCFVKGVRENSKRDICALQEKILKDMTHHKYKITDVEDGAELIQTRFCKKKVFLVLDDVDDAKQLEFLAATHKWFGAGSRVIITTRDLHLLSDTDAIYKPAFLVEEHANELFSQHAFRRNSPPEGYKELSNRAIRYTGGLPLALKVLGSFLHGRKQSVWESALNRLAKTPKVEIFETLKVSFDGLEASEKKIFLDIACFFKGHSEERVSRVLDSFGFDPMIGISALKEKSLITVSNERIRMHDVLQEMGLEIVRNSYPNSRLSQCEEIHDLIAKNRFMPNLKFIQLEDLRCIESFPDVSGAPNVERLIFSGCTNLVEVHKSLGSLRKLAYLNMNGCWDLKCLPSLVEIPLLETIDLSYCLSLEKFVEVSSGMEKLSNIYLNGCSNLKIIPSSICELKNLKSLHLQECEQLQKLPEELGSMENLKELWLGFVDHVMIFPRKPDSINFHSLTNLCCLRKLDLSWRQIEEQDFPTNFHAFSSLEELDLSGNCKLVQLYPQASPAFLVLNT